MRPYRTPFSTSDSAQAALAYSCVAMSMLRLESASFGPSVLPRPSSSTPNSGSCQCGIIACIPQSGDVPLYDGEVIHALVQTVPVPPASNHAYAVSSRTTTDACRVLTVERAALEEGKSSVLVIEGVYSVDDIVVPLLAMLHSMNEVFSAGNSCSRGHQVIFHLSRSNSSIT